MTLSILDAILKTEVENQGFGSLSLESGVEVVTYKSKAQELLDLEAAFDSVTPGPDGYYSDADSLQILYPYLIVNSFYTDHR